MEKEEQLENQVYVGLKECLARLEHLDFVAQWVLRDSQDLQGLQVLQEMDQVDQ